MLASMTRRFRDLLVFEATGSLVIACDSIGGIGPKPADTIAADARTTAHFGVRVPLLEVLCAGARPIALVDTLCVERHPTGQLMIDEIRALAAEAGIPPQAVTGSTEENVLTTATGIGITVIAALDDELPKAQPGDVVVCVGLPISAPDFEIRIGHPDQVSVGEVRALLDSGLVHDALPVGSRGVSFEVAEMARVADLAFTQLDCPIDLHHSGGPASCVLFACAPQAAAALTRCLAPGRPVTQVARFTSLNPAN